MILDNYQKFIDEIYNRVANLGIDIESLKIDHLGYQAESPKDYNDQVSLISTCTTKISENIVGGRKVGVFQLQNHLEYQNQTFNIIEIFEPREGQIVKSAWEHIEFLVESTLEEFMNKYPNITWDISALDREEFPMLILLLGDGWRAKFPRRGVLDEVQRQKGKSDI